MKYVLAADIGGTNIRTALISPAGEIVQQHRQRVDLSTCANTTEDVIKTLVQQLEPMAAKASSIGIGFPGFFHGKSGVLAASPNLPALRELPLADILETHLGCDVQIQNDALCAALGEFHFGAGKGKSHLIHITLGTGVGGSLILQRQPLYGEGGMAMEFGHLCVDTSANAPRCNCGKQGCVEAFASATAIRRLYAAERNKGLDAVDIYQLAEQGDAFAASLFTQAGHRLGQAIAEAVKLLDVYTVSISGGLTGAWPRIHPPMMQSLEANVISPQRGLIRVLPSTLYDQGGVLGAASLAMGLS